MSLPIRIFAILLSLASVGCAPLVTTPLKVASDLVVKPTKIVTKAALDIVEEPAKRAIKWAKPTRPWKMIP